MKGFHLMMIQHRPAFGHRQPARQAAPAKEVSDRVTDSSLFDASHILTLATGWAFPGVTSMETLSKVMQLVTGNSHEQIQALRTSEEGLAQLQALQDITQEILLMQFPSCKQMKADLDAAAARQQDHTRLMPDMKRQFEREHGLFVTLSRAGRA